jgi:hypothetical protein
MFTNFVLNAIQGIVVGLVSLPFVIIIHELGHLLFGKLSGYQFASLRLILFQWAKDKDNKIKFTRASSLGGGVGGQCLMIPSQDERDFRFILYNLGGSLTNIIVGIALIIPLFFSSGQTIMRWLFIAGIVSIFIAVANLIPSASGGFPNDGRNILEARKSEDAKKGFYRMLKANGEMSLGKQLSDFDEKFFEIDANADVNNFLVAYSILLHSAYLEELGHYEKSYEQLLRVEKAKIPSVYQAQVLMALLFNELVYQTDNESMERAKERMKFSKDNKNDKDIIAIIEIKHPSFMIPYAAKKAFIDFDSRSAKTLISEAEKLIPSLQNPGSEHHLRITIKRLKERLPELALDESVSEALPVAEPTLEDSFDEVLPVAEPTLGESIGEAFPVEITPKETVTEILINREEKVETSTNNSEESNNNFDDIMEKLRSRRNDS